MGAKYSASAPVLQLTGNDAFRVRHQQYIWHSGHAELWDETAIQPHYRALPAFLNGIILVPLCYWFKAPGAATHLG